MTYSPAGSQRFQGTDESIVQIAGDHHAEYIDGHRRAMVEIDFRPPRIVIFEQRVSPWHSGMELVAMSADERSTVVARVAEAFRSGGFDVSVSPR